MISIQTRDFPKLVYRKSGKGPVIMLLHGFPENGEMWNSVCESLADKYTVIVPDIPGSGDSSFKGEKIDIDTLALSVKAIIDHEKLEKIVLAGHSMGGYIAFAFAAIFPQHLAGLTLVHSTSAADTDEKKENRRKAIEILKKGGKETFVKQMIPNLFSDNFKQNHIEVVNEQILSGLELDVKSMIAYYEAMAERDDKLDVVKQAQFPIQWIAGKDDRVIPSETILKQTYLSNINFVSLYDNCGHMSMFENAKILSFDLSVFLRYCYNEKID